MMPGRNRLKLGHCSLLCSVNCCDIVPSFPLDSVVCSVCFSPDGKSLATGCKRTAQIYDTRTGARTWYAVLNSGDLVLHLLTC
jgi:WD40 repeat protein